MVTLLNLARLRQSVEVLHQQIHHQSLVSNISSILLKDSVSFSMQNLFLSFSKPNTAGTLCSAFNLTYLPNTLFHMLAFAFIDYDINSLSVCSMLCLAQWKVSEDSKLFSFSRPHTYGNKHQRGSNKRFRAVKRVEMKGRGFLEQGTSFQCWNIHSICVTKFAKIRII